MYYQRSYMGTNTINKKFNRFSMKQFLDEEIDSIVKRQMNKHEIFKGVYSDTQLEGDISGDLIFDIDFTGHANYVNNIITASEGTQLILIYLLVDLKIIHKHIKVYFSGYKGFHIVVHKKALGLVNSSKLIFFHKILAESIQERTGVIIDMCIYQPTRLLRMPGSFNFKLYHAKANNFLNIPLQMLEKVKKIEISIDMLKSINNPEAVVDLIKLSANTPFEKASTPFGISDDQTEESVKIINKILVERQEALKTEETVKRAPRVKCVTKEAPSPLVVNVNNEECSKLIHELRFAPCLHFIAGNGCDEGYRFLGAYVLINYMKFSKFNRDTMVQIIEFYVSKCRGNTPFGMKDLLPLLNSNKMYSVGCHSSDSKIIEMIKGGQTICNNIKCKWS